MLRARRVSSTWTTGASAFLGGLLAGWLLSRRLTSEPDPSADGPKGLRTDDGSVSEAAAQVAFQLSRDQLSAELSGADSDDFKALGFLAVDVAAIALLVTVHKDLSRYWWTLTFGFALSATLLLVSLWRRDFDTGQRPREFYSEALADPGILSAEDLLVFASGGLADSRQDDERTRERKAFWYTGSLACLIVVAVMSALVLWLVR